MRWLWVLGLVGLPMSAWASQVCLEVGTGRLLEYQEHARVGTCAANMAVSHPGVVFEEQTVTPQEWAVLKEELLDKPAREQAERDKPVEIPLKDFGAALGGLAGAASLVIVARRKKGVPP